MEFSSIDQFLESLDGEVESSGSFELNLDAARKKLQSFQLPDPGLYPVFLVAAATASEATNFQVWTGPEETRFEFDGRLFQSDELQALDGYLFASPDVPARLQHLAIALKAAGELVDSFEFRSGLVRLTWADGDWECRESEDVKKSTLLVPKHRSFLHRFKVKPPDLQETMSICRFAPLNIKFNTAYPGWFWSFKRPLICLELTTEKKIGRPPVGYNCHRQKVASPGPFGGSLALVKEAEARDLLVIVHGIAHPIPIDAPHLEGVIWHDGLTRDLSCTQLVHDRQMSEFLEQLKSQIAGMILRRVTSPEAFDAGDRETLEPLAGQAAEHFRKQGDSAAAETLEQWIRADETDIPELDSAQGYRKFLDRLQLEGQSPKGTALRARALELFTAQAKKAADAGCWQKLVPPVSRMRTLFVEPNENLEALALCLAVLCDKKYLEVSLDWRKSELCLLNALALLATNEWEKSRELLHQILSLRPRDAGWILASAYLNREMPREALEVALVVEQSADEMEEFTRSECGTGEQFQLQRQNNAVCRELVADCLETTGEKERALDIRAEALPEKPRDKQLQAWRIKYIKDRSAGLVPFWETVRWHTKTLVAQWRADGAEPPYYCPRSQRESMEKRWQRLAGFIQHKWSGPIEEDLEFLFGDTFANHARTDFYLGRVAHEMRRRGEFERAERMLLRVALIEMARSFSSRLLHGPRTR